MVPKYHVEFTVVFKNHTHTDRYQTHDVKACEAFLAELLERGVKIRGLKCNHEPLPQSESDKMIKTAAWMLARKHISDSLGLSQEEARKRF